MAVVAAVQAVLLRNGDRGARTENPTQAATGLVTVDSTPRGATVAVNGQSKGLTPLTVTLEPGNHSVEVVHEGSRQTLPVTVAAGSRSSQHILFGANTQNRGRLQITSQPPGAKVTIDGNSRGVTPLTLTDVTPGPHVVVLDSAQGTTRQTVMVEEEAWRHSRCNAATGVSGGFLRVPRRSTSSCSRTTH